MSASRRGRPRHDLARFAEDVVRILGRRPSDVDLLAALSAVSLQPKQHTAKLSPVLQPERLDDGSRAGPKAVSPYCAATYVSFLTCPTSCGFLTDPVTGVRQGCFVAGNVNQLRCTDPLDESARGITDPDGGVLIALAEAHVIRTAFPDGVPQDGAHGGRDLRLHIAGDAIGATAAEVLAAAADDYKANGGGAVWTFTHAWRGTPRSAWGGVSVLASVESALGARAANRLGYPAAIVLEKLPEDGRAFELPELPGKRVVPCPAETGRTTTTGAPVTCVTCRLCLDGGLLERGTVIAFGTHGRNKRAAQENTGKQVRDGNILALPRPSVIP